MRARRIDATHKPLSRVFEQLGWLVHPTNGDWDATVCKSGIIRLIEYKDPKSPNLKRKNKGDKLKAEGWPIDRVMTVNDVISIDQQISRETSRNSV